MWTKKFKYCELKRVWEKIFVIGVILETPMDASLETPMDATLETPMDASLETPLGPYFHWRPAYFYCRPQSHIFV